MAKVLKGANATAQWYFDNFPGGTIFDRLEKFAVHTTETRGWPGYGGGASAPNATYFPARREIRQHFPNNVSARALEDRSKTPVRENRDRIFQLEIIAYSDKEKGDTVNGLWIGDLTDAHFTDIAQMMIQLNEEEGLPLRTSVTWKEGSTSFVSGVRLSSASFDAYRGILGHVHVSGNAHWDPGGFRASQLTAKIAELTTQAPPAPIRKVPTMFLVKQDNTERVWAITGDSKRRFVASRTALEALEAAGVPFNRDITWTGAMLQSFPQQPNSDITDVLPTP
jgi:hypothetical protein